VRIAHESNAAVELIHHVRKGANQDKFEVTAESGRGAKARSVRVINGMSADEAGAANVDPKDRFDFFRIDSGYGQSRAQERPFRMAMVSVSLGNSGGLNEPPDSVGVVTPWEWPTAASLTEDVPEGALAGC
jgi:hypothetical protein